MSNCYNGYMVNNNNKKRNYSTIDTQIENHVLRKDPEVAYFFFK